MRNKVLIISISAFILFVIPWLSLSVFRNIGNIQTWMAITNKSVYNHQFSSSYLIGVAAYTNHEFAKSIDILQAIDKAKRPPVRWYLARAYLHENNSQAALSVLRGNTFADRMLFRQVLTEYLVRFTEREDQEWQQYVVQVHPDDILTYASQLLTDQQFVRAEVWARMLPDYTDSSDALIIIGSSYFYRGAMDEAEGYFKQAYDVNPTDYAAYWYGRVFLVRGKTDQAVPLLKEAIRKTSSNVAIAWYLRELGTAYAQTGRCIDAYAAYDLALQRDPAPDNMKRIATARAASTASCSIH